MRSAVEQAVNGGEKNERVSVKLAQDQSGKAVIVAKDRRLLRIDVGDGVIFIYHGDRAQLEKFFKGLAKNAIAIQITEIILTNQHHLASSEYQAGKSIGQRVHLQRIKLIAGITYNTGSHLDHNPASIHQKRTTIDPVGM